MESSASAVRSVEHQRLADLHHMFWATHGRRRVRRHDLAGDQPIEQHAHGGELLLHAWRRMGLLEQLYIGGDIERPDRGNVSPRSSHQAKNWRQARA